MQNTSEAKVNPDLIINNALNSRLDLYRGKETYEAMFKKYNDNMDTLIQLINFMQKNIMELQVENGRLKAEILSLKSQQEVAKRDKTEGIQ